MKLNISLFTCIVLCTTLNANEVIELDSINVVSSTINDKFEEKQSAVSSTSIVSSQDVEKINPQSVSDILNKIPGITTTLTGTDSLKVHIRGVDNQRYMGEKPGVAIVIDGVPVQETTGKINVNLDNIESIKVIKGSASYLYGNDAIAGAVIITTKDPKGVSSSNLESEIGSFGSKRLVLGTNQTFENSALQIQGSTRSSDGYWDDAYVKSKSFNGKYQYYFDDSDLTFGLGYTKRETGDGNSVRGITEANENPTSEGYYSYSGYYNSDLIKTFLTYTKVFEDESELMLRAHKYVDDKTYNSRRLVYDNSEVWDQNGAKGEYKKTFSDIGFMIGFDLQRNNTEETRNLVSDGSLDEDYNTEEDINALYTEVKYKITDKLTTTFNMRFDNIQQKFEDKIDSSNNVDPEYNIFSYRGGLKYKFNDNLSLYSNISTGFRTPTVAQTSTNQVSLADDPTLDIPSEIDVEQTYNYEIGIRGKEGLISYDASIFQIDRKDYIGRIAGSYVTSDDDDESNYNNVGDMRSRGLELSLSSDSSKTISFDLAYTYLQSKFTDYWISQQLTENTAGWGASNATFQRVDLSGNYVSRSPRHTINLTMNYKLTDKWDISPELVYKGNYYADEANQFKQGGYTVVNLRTNYKYSNSLEFFGKIDNLFDKDYFQFVHVNSSALATMEDATIRVAPPRMFFAGLRYKF